MTRPTGKTRRRSAMAPLADAEPYAGYEPLAAVLAAAVDQAARGKGRERHAGQGQDFEGQPMLAITRMVGLGFPLGQAQKKAQEAARLAAGGDARAAEAELLGAIVFLAGAVLALRDGARP